VQADYAVELGAQDEALELPWAAHDQGLEYYDLKRHPELLAEIKEAQANPELKEFLTSINSSASILETAKCDVWSSAEMNPDEDIFAAAVKFGSYVDLIFSEPSRRFSLMDHEDLAKNLTELLKRAPEIPASAEFLIRRCYYNYDDDRMRDGFYITVYIFGYGGYESRARKQWAIGLKLVENALLQLSRNG
jgi:hypothetical protein